MKHRKKIVVTSLILLIVLASLLTEGCLGQGSGLSRENGTEVKGEVDTHGLSQEGRLKTEEVTLSGSEAGTSYIAGSSCL